MLTAIATIVGSVISGLVAIYVCTVQNNKTIALIEYRLSQLENEVRKHNTFDRRLIIVETKLGIKEK